ncbi:unnamed protein product, partial [Ixodes pacificus]
MSSWLSGCSMYASHTDLRWAMSDVRPTLLSLLSPLFATHSHVETAHIYKRQSRSDEQHRCTTITKTTTSPEWESPCRERRNTEKRNKQPTKKKEKKKAAAPFRGAFYFSPQSAEENPKRRLEASAVCSRRCQTARLRRLL